ncbi:FkbM family methyltransferase [Methylophaga thalassica]|uniref:FkbM family methyltransferase n=1 Tax=Methylophaga aminisulfidivorans TaxID=230105 RepID=UPI0024E1E2CD|nr:FkbM family methyltransferase [Methylophaga aminisulfidivorans]
MYKKQNKVFIADFLNLIRKKYFFLKCEVRDIYNSYLSKSTKPKMTPYGFNLVGSSSMHHIAMQKGEFEPEETKLFIQEFNRSDIFIDIGANIGFYSCLAKSYNKHVIAIEPMKKNLDYLMANIEVNNWSDIEVFPIGLSSQPGIASLYGASSTGASLVDNWAGSSGFFKRTIPLSSLDIILGERFKNRHLFIKVDVEGAEYNLLLGAINVIKREPKPTWIIEICLNEYHPDGFNPYYENTFNLFWNHGYEVRTADQRNILITKEDVQKWLSQNKSESGTINYKFSAPVDAQL